MRLASVSPQSKSEYVRTPQGSSSVRRHSKLALLLLLAGVLMFVLWPAQAFAAGASFDLQTAINACAVGGTVTVPAGTWNVPARINLTKSISIVGTPGQSILTASFDDPILVAYNTSGVTFSGLTLRGPGASSGDSTGIQFYAPTNVTIRDINCSALHYGLKFGSGTQGSGVNADTLTLHDCAEPLEIANLSDSSFSNVDIQAPNLNTNQWHGIYLERSLHNIAFRNLSIIGGSGYCLQLYTESGASDHLSFENVTLDATDGRFPLVIWGYSSVTFTNLNMVNVRSDGPCVRLHGSASNVTIDGFSASGGYSLAAPYTGQTPQAVVLRNGAYDGQTLGSGATFENVTVGGTTPTTVAPTTSTTVAPTTSTTLAPTTTTASTTTSTTTTTVVTPSTTTTSTSTTVAPTTSTTLAPTTTTTVAPKSPAAEVTITSPADGSSVAKGRVMVSASVTSSVKIGKVVLYVDGRKLATDYLAKYYFSWTTRYLSSGSLHTLKAVAYDRSGVEIGSASSVVRVR